MQSKEIIEFLKRTDAKDFISRYRNTHPDEVLLRMNTLTPQERRALATLIKIYPKAEDKIPEFLKSYPALTEKAYEQSSSEALAQYKASLMQGKSLLNLSGGLGIDDIAFSQKFENIISLDVDEEIHEMAAFNIQQLGLNNIQRIHYDSEAFEIPLVDVIYVDPDRRVHNKRSFHLEDATPDIIRGHTHWLKKATHVFIKLSPMADLTEIKRNLKGICEIHVISLENEVKEVLVKLGQTANHPPKTYAVILSGVHIYTFEEGKEHEVKEAVNGIRIFAEAAAALIKANLDREDFARLGFKRCGPHAAFYEGSNLSEILPGRAFEISAQFEFSGQKFKDYLKEHRIEKAHVKKRDFPMEPDEIKSKYHLKDGGDDYFFFYMNDQKKKMMVHGRKPVQKISLF